MENRIIHRQDDTFVIEYNGNPYHLTPTCGQKAMYAETLAQYKAKPKKFEEEYPPEPPSPEEVRKGEILAELAKIDTEYRTDRTLADAVLGNKWAIARLEEAERLAEPLRTELAELLEAENE